MTSCNSDSNAIFTYLREIGGHMPWKVMLAHAVEHVRRQGRPGEVPQNFAAPCSLQESFSRQNQLLNAIARNGKVNSLSLTTSRRSSPKPPVGSRWPADRPPPAASQAHSTGDSRSRPMERQPQTKTEKQVPKGRSQVMQAGGRQAVRVEVDENRRVRIQQLKTAGQ